MAELRVMTWNVQNLFTPDHDSGPDTRGDFETKLESLATVIDEFRPHLLGLQEVGSQEALAALQGAPTHRMPHRALGEPDQRGIRVAFVSTRVLRDVTTIRNFPDGLLPIQVGDDPAGPAGPPLMNQMGRSGLQVTIRANGRDVRVANCHLKSKLLTFPGGRFSTEDPDERARVGAYALFRRASEATTLRIHANRELDGGGRTEPYVLLGDFNDEVDAATTQIVNGPPGSEIGTRGFERPDRGDGDRLWNLAPLIPERERFSRIYRGRPELIDHVFASNFLVADDRTVSVRSLVCHDDDLPSIDDTPTQHYPRPGSDHAAIAATFDF